MHDLRSELVKQNKDVHWEPEHIRDGRFGAWISGAKDWAISRERYWGTPLPVWENEDATERVVIGSLKELSKRTKSGHNTYIAIRHGEATSNVKQITSTTVASASTDILTEKGRSEVLESAKKLATDGDFDFIFTSPFARTRETASIIAKELGIPDTRVILEDRIREIGVGVLDGKPYSKYLAFFEKFEDRFIKAPEGGETLNDVRKRVGALLYDLETRYKGKRILLVSHSRTVWALYASAHGLSTKESMKISVPDNAGIVPLNFVPLPHNENFELDPHRPYIDDVVLEGGSGEELHRVKEVVDVWFDSGAMPFASEHYPFENKEWVEGVGYPADFISEAIDQTRGWFYTLLAIGTLVGRGKAYKNVISLGHLLDGNGQKMSKSKGNVVNPWEAISRWGADTLRFWMYSVNQPGESKSFDEKTVRESARTLSWFDNSTKFYDLFKNEVSDDDAQLQIVDKWMKIRTQETVVAVTKYFDAYKYFEGARSIAALLEDLSQWYVRRIRDRARAGDKAAIETLRETLRTISLLLAPLTPFIAEQVFQSTRMDSDPESVHLAEWPKEKQSYWSRLVSMFFASDDKELLENMSKVRSIASEALMLRQKAGVKVRQPLTELSIKDELPADFANIVSEEVNVEHVKMSQKKLSLNTKLTNELIKKGDVREFLRALAEARKSEGLSPKDKIKLSISDSGKDVLSNVSINGVSLVEFELKDTSKYKAGLSFGDVNFSITKHAS